jgi:hypothetical protein
MKIVKPMGKHRRAKYATETPSTASQEFIEMNATILYKPFFDESEPSEQSDCGNNHCIAVYSQIKARGDVA